jgi:hypothetical protein
MYRTSRNIDEGDGISYNDWCFVMAFNEITLAIIEYCDNIEDYRDFLDILFEIVDQCWYKGHRTSFFRFRFMHMKMLPKNKELKEDWIQ